MKRHKNSLAQRMDNHPLQRIMKIVHNNKKIVTPLRMTKRQQTMRIPKTPPRIITLKMRIRTRDVKIIWWTCQKY